MKAQKIIINGNGQIDIPEKKRMKPFEIAELFGITTRSVNAHIRNIIQSGGVTEDFSGDLLVSGKTLIPEDFGLEMIIALAFRIRSYRAEQFRKWVMDNIKDNSNTDSYVIRLITNKLPN